MPGGQCQAAVKLYGVFSRCRGLPDCAPAQGVHGAPGWDSGDRVDPFMRAGTYPARHLATLRGSELPPAFSGASPGWTRVSPDRQWPGFSPRTHPFGLAGTYVFIKQSGPPCHCDLSGPFYDPDRHPFFRRYRANLPSSLAWVTPQTPWASHPGAPVSVLGTVSPDRSGLPFHGNQDSGEPS